MPVNAKGSRRERELLEKLTKEGFVVHRVAGSGHGESAICDLVAVKNGKVHFVECKSRKRMYYPKGDREQLEKLIVIANSCKAIPMLAVKLNYKDWKLVNISKGVPQKV